jgi:chromosome partitioning protein
LTKCIAFHSYKGGTGKTTLGANFAASLAKSGYRVALIDLDVYAPSLQSYFDNEPNKWINDFLYSNAEIDDIMVDMTPVVSKLLGETSGAFPGSAPSAASDSIDKKDKEINGKLWVGFSSTKKEDIFKLEGSGGGGENMRRQFLKRFILLREQLISSYDSDFIVIDTSPGIRYWSINALAVADILFLTLKMGDLDIEGTKKIVEEIYGSFTKFGTKSFLLLNRVAGYCVPHTFPGGKGQEPLKEHSPNIRFSVSSSLPTIAVDPSYSQQAMQADVGKMLSDELRMKVISSVPCYCDIQFLRKEFLTALKFPSHPFAVKIEELIETMKQ